MLKRSAALRFCLDIEGSKLSHVELRCCDGSCCIYLALAAMIEAGLRGMQQQDLLPPPDKVRMMPACPAQHRSSQQLLLLPLP